MAAQNKQINCDYVILWIGKIKGHLKHVASHFSANKPKSIQLCPHFSLYSSARTIMNPFNDLSDGNGEQIRRYLKFFRQKKEGYLRSTSGEFQECKADRLSEDMFSREDVEEIIDYLQSAVRVWLLLSLTLWEDSHLFPLSLCVCVYYYHCCVIFARPKLARISQPLLIWRHWMLVNYW